jgi:hypothetical protein
MLKKYSADCATCGLAFTYTTKWPPRRYCSPPCKYQAALARNRAKAAAKKAAREPFTCPVCGASFLWCGMGQRQIYCTPRCKSRVGLSRNPEARLAQHRRYYQRNREAIGARAREKRAANREQHNAKAREYRRANRAQYAEQGRRRYLANRERIIAEVKRYYVKNRERVLSQKREYSQVNRERINARSRNNYQTSPRKRLRDSISRLINKSLISGKGSKRWSELVDYTLDELMAHLEQRFLPGMTWENHGRDGWHVDHIRPIASFSFSSPDDPSFSECWGLENLQPLWARDNLRKNARLNWAKECPRDPGYDYSA